MNKTSDMECCCSFPTYNCKSVLLLATKLNLKLKADIRLLRGKVVVFPPPHFVHVTENSTKSNPVAGTKENFRETACVLADGLVYLCISYRCISIKLRLFHNQLKSVDREVTATRQFLDLK